MRFTHDMHFSPPPIQEFLLNRKAYEEISQRLYIISTTKIDNFNRFYGTIETC